MVHFVHVLLLVPETGRLINENEVLITVIDHARAIVPVHVLKQNEKLEHVGCVNGTNHSSLSRVVHVHVLVIVTVSVGRKVPRASILELLGNLPPVPVFAHPGKRGSTVGSVDLEQVKSRGKTKSCDGHCFPEADPFDNFVIFINNLTKLK